MKSPQKILKRLLKKAYATKILNEKSAHNTLLSNHTGKDRELAIQHFKKCDQNWLEEEGAAAISIRENLLKFCPNQSTPQDKDAFALILKESKKKMRHIPVRELLEKTKKIIHNITPCLMMSPLSCARFLSENTEAFDLVIFDEASQIKTCEAIGAITRAKQAIIVGDPKQLPPTSFFKKEAEENEALGDNVDEESILDECLTAGIPEILLSWHYRSRNESLIDFSNHHYYQGKLVTFPAPNISDQALSFVHVKDAIYQSGNGSNKNNAACTNPVEATEVVEAVVNHAKEQKKREALGLAIQSLGIITFNKSQRDLISQLIANQALKYPELSLLLSEEAETDLDCVPLLIRNLEEVQGEERDIMFFSTTFGPDRTGKFSQNFGPLNRKGGEALPKRTYQTFDSPFEEEVATLLHKKGWEVHPQVGVGSFRIDLGIVNPDMPQTYLAGIECDGASYHSRASARDRDIVRQEVLQGMGWQILRIWSSDWWTHADKEIDRLDQKLKMLLEKEREKTPSKKIA
ncbi:hypothetical protein FAI41_03020 [Acetobacteraceae bacterium]|nr:hypothetical protein FAI41_03020 [Acetobacteraceae bacterium]